MNLSSSTLLHPEHAALAQKSPHRAAVLILFILAFAIRAFRLGDVEFWFDEAATYVFAIKGLLGNIEFSQIAGGEHPPGYYWLVDAWMVVAGSTEFAIRFISLFFGLAVIALLYRLTSRELGKAIGLGVLTSAVFAPFLITYSREARMYTLLLFWTVLAIDLFLAVVRQGRRRDMLLFSIVSLCGMATHYFFAVSFVGEFVFFLIQGRSLNRRAAIRWIGLMTIATAEIILWASVAPGLRGNLFSAQVGGYWVPPVEYRLAQVVQDLAWQSNFGTLLPLPAQLFAMLCWLPAIFGVAFVDDAKPNGKEFKRLLASLIVGGFVTIIILKQGVIGRHLAVMYPAFLILSVLGVLELYRRGGTRGALALAMLCSLWALGIYTEFVDYKGDYGAATAYMEQHLSPADAIVTAQPWNWPIIDYYHRHSNVPITFFPEKPFFAVVGTPPLDPEPEAIINFLAPVSAAHQRIWIGVTGSRTNDPGQTMPRWLSETAFAAHVTYERASSFELFVNGKIDSPLIVPPADFGNQIHLDSASVSGSAIKPGDAVLMELHWTPRARISADELLILQLVDERGHSWAEEHMPPCGGFCLTSEWKENEPVLDRHALVVPIGAPPGSYHVRLKLFHPPSGTALPVKAAKGVIDGNSLDLGIVKVAPDTSAVLPWIEHSSNAALGSGLTLAGFDGAPAAVQADSAWPVDLVWKVTGPVLADTALRFQWVDGLGRVVGGSVLSLASGGYPESAWQVGEVIRQHYDVPVIGQRSATGLHIVLQAEQHGAVSGPAVSLGDVRVDRIAHSFLALAPTHLLAAEFGQMASLTGFDVETLSRRRIALTLAWRALHSNGSRYKVFVHLLGDDNSLLAQDDSEPANNLRPTTTWLDGEYLADEHIIAVPDAVKAGTYAVEIGMYDPTSGQRLSVTQAGAEQEGQRLLLTTVDVK